MHDVTAILSRLQDGQPTAAEDLLPLVYDELRRLATARMARERPGQTLQPTALVHEAYLRLVDAEHQTWQNRRHFFGAAAEAMRRILIDRARRRVVREKAGFAEREEDWESRIIVTAPSDEMLSIDEALDKLTKEDPIAGELVKLRYFVGLPMPEAAEALGMPQRSAERVWTFAKAWLRRELNR